MTDNTDYFNKVAKDVAAAIEKNRSQLFRDIRGKFATLDPNDARTFSLMLNTMLNAGMTPQQVSVVLITSSLAVKRSAETAPENAGYRRWCVEKLLDFMAKPDSEPPPPPFSGNAKILKFDRT